MVMRNGLSFYSSLLLLATLPTRVFGGILSTDGFSNCVNHPTIVVHDMDIKFDSDTDLITFDVSGTSKERQKVMATLTVAAYGNQIYSKTFNPCSNASYVEQLCPVPAGTFTAVGQKHVPSQYASMIPSIAFAVPDLAGDAKLELKPVGGGKPIACITSPVGNGKTAKVKAATYAAVGMVGAALLLSGVSALGSFAHPSTASSSPTFTEVLGWFQSMSMNGMLTVQYPAIYSSFTQNFGFSTGLISWESMEKNIDTFRAETGGNLTDASVPYLLHTTLLQGNGSSTGYSKRSLASSIYDTVSLYTRQVHTSVNSSTHSGSSSHGNKNQTTFVSGIQGYAEELAIPSPNVFMTVLLVFAIVIAAITAGILLFKVILEAWALFGTFPKKLTSFRKRYWWLLAKTITSLIFALYSVWTMYCIYQFIDGDSWAAKLLAGVTFGIFTAVLVGFTIKIFLKAKQSKKVLGDTSALYEDKQVWVKYSHFYDNYKKSFWWLFIPVIIYSFAKGIIIAAGDGHGLVQCGGQLILDAALLILLIWSRPFARKSGTWINIIIQIVRVISVACILVFVEELGIDQTTKTVVGVVLIVVQAVLTVLLGILIAVNAIIGCCNLNPHRKARKDAEKLKQQQDELTPLDAHNSMLLYPIDQKQPDHDVSSLHTRGRSQNGYDMVSNREVTPLGYRDPSLMARSSMEMDYMHREPQLPDLEYKGRGVAL